MFTHEITLYSQFSHLHSVIAVSVFLQRAFVLEAKTLVVPEFRSVNTAGVPVDVSSNVR